MKSVRPLICLVAFATSVLASGACAAADNCSGHYANVGARSISVDNDRTKTSHVMIGECNSQGVCTRRDADGDEITVESAYTPGEYLATWKMTRGTGKYAKARQSGWYKQTRADGDVVVGDWGGNCQ